MIAIIDYGMGNLHSVYNALQAIGAQAEITSDPEQLKQADGIILPGVGAFRDCMRNLEQSGLIDTIKSEAEQGKPLLGICLGMQVLFEKGYEVEECAGLGLLQGEIRLMEDPDVKIPHIGWNSLDFPHEGRLFAGLKEQPYVYFVHSYYLKAKDPSIVKATTEYGVTIHASVEKGNLFACQFHPEKSSTVGLQILKNFAEI